MTGKDELDARLRVVTSPAPVIAVGPGFPIATFDGYNDPYPGWYRGCRVRDNPALEGAFEVVENEHPSE